MSAIVQLSYNINEKLHLEDRKYPDFEAHGTDLQNRSSTNNSTSLAKNDTTEQWTSSLGNTIVTSAASVTSTVEQLSSVSEPLDGNSDSRFDHKKTSSIRRYELQPSTLPKTSSKTKDSSETTLYKLRDGSSQKKSFNFNQKDKVQVSKSSADFNARYCTALNSQSQGGSDAFPSIGLVGRSCTLQPREQPATSGNSALSDVPPIKKHCRSVSELDKLSPSSSASPHWKPVQSRVWVPIECLHRSTASSASSFAGRIAGDCSRSLDYGSLRSRESCFSDSQFTPPASPVPRPASVTVIKQESGAWTFLSSQKVLSGLSVTCSPRPATNFTSPSMRLHDAAGKSNSHSGFAATKRSLSFSADFEHRKSIEYTPASTPELGKRIDQDSKRVGLSRCQSHPSGLNVKRSKCRRRSRLSNNRPTLDFAKMKQTAFAKPQSDDASNSMTVENDISQILSVKPVFPSIVAPDKSMKKSKFNNLAPIRSAASPVALPVSFSIGCHKPLSDIQHRIPSPADEALNEQEEDCTNMSMFVPECPDLNVEDIENEED